MKKLKKRKTDQVHCLPGKARGSPNLQSILAMPCPVNSLKICRHRTKVTQSNPEDRMKLRGEEAPVFFFN
jgi:hypothetical protein